MCMVNSCNMVKRVLPSPTNYSPPQTVVEYATYNSLGFQATTTDADGCVTAYQRGDWDYTDSQTTYVRWQRNGQALDKNGNVVPKNTPSAHIPLDQFKFDPELFK